MDSKNSCGICTNHGYGAFDTRANRRAHRFNHPIRMKRINKRKQSRLRSDC